VVIVAGRCNSDRIRRNLLMAPVADIASVIPYNAAPAADAVRGINLRWLIPSAKCWKRNGLP
jgi:hypothetical protein